MDARGGFGMDARGGFGMDARGGRRHAAVARHRGQPRRAAAQLALRVMIVLAGF